MSKNGIDHRHCKWPLGTQVLVRTPQGYLRGTINRHQTAVRCRHGCDVAFEEIVDLGDGNGARYCHHIPFRSMRRVNPLTVRPKRPWYKS